MTKEVLKMALEALKGVLDDTPKVLDASIAGGLYEVVQCRDAITAIKEALAQPEPVAWEQFYPDIGKPQLTYPPQGIYYTPPQRTCEGCGKVAKP